MFAVQHFSFLFLPFERTLFADAIPSLLFLGFDISFILLAGSFLERVGGRGDAAFRVFLRATISVKLFVLARGALCLLLRGHTSQGHFACPHTFLHECFVGLCKSVSYFTEV